MSRKVIGIYMSYLSAGEVKYTGMVGCRMNVFMDGANIIGGAKISIHLVHAVFVPGNDILYFGRQIINIAGLIFLCVEISRVC
jgi:hypothetical protein